MKRWPSAAAMMGAVLLTHAAARADNLPGFQNTRWGMTEQQVQEIYDGKLENWEIFMKSPTPAIPSRTFKQFGLKHYDVEGCDFTVSFHFEQTGLSMVSLSLINTKKIECGTVIADLLLGKYGHPAVDDLDRSGSSDSRMRKWILGPTLIRLSTNFFKGGPDATNLVTIYYNRTDPPDASKL